MSAFGAQLRKINISPSTINTCERKGVRVANKSHKKEDTNKQNHSKLSAATTN